MDVQARPLLAHVAKRVASDDAVDDCSEPIAVLCRAALDFLDGWQVVSGTWTRGSAGGGANGTAFYARSSQLLNDQCDRIQSPLLTLTAASTLSLSSRYQIEPFGGGEHYDRANVAVANGATRTVVVPDAGNLYSVPAGSIFRGCGMQDDPGWNGTNPASPGFDASSWSAGALNPGGAFSGEPVRLDVLYATDVVVAMDGFRFDEVTLTNFAEQGPDAQPDACAVVQYFDGFDDASLPPWTFLGPWRGQHNGHLSTRRGPATAIADDFGGCEKCRFTTAFRIGAGRRAAASPRVFLYLHWRDDSSYVVLELGGGSAQLARFKEGALEHTAAAPFALARHRRYQVAIAFDGGAYDVAVDGELLLTMPVSDSWNGTFGLGSDGARTLFDYVRME